VNISRNITLIRHVADLTQTEFGKLVGATKAMIISYEKAKSQPKPLLAQRIADIGSVSMEDLFARSLKEKDIRISIKKVEKVANGESASSQAKAESGEEQELSPQEYSNKSIYNLTESTRIIAEANSKLVDQSYELTMMVKSTVNSSKESSVDVDARITDVLEVIGLVGTEKGWWHSPQEAFAELSRLFHGRKPIVPAAGIQTG
jgi:DNA-binding XRE family transcriptional regulator